MKISRIKQIEDKILELEKEKQDLKIRGEKYLKNIENGNGFGYHGAYDYYGEGSYYPCELLEVVDREHFLIKIREISIDEITITDVFGLHIDENPEKLK